MPCGATPDRGPMRGQNFDQTQPIRIRNLQNNSRHSSGRPCHNLPNPRTNLPSIHNECPGRQRRKLTRHPQRLSPSNSAK